MEQHHTNPMIHKAFHGLTELSADDIARDLAERREKALKDEAMFLAEAMDKGIKQGTEQGIKQGTEQGAKQGSEDKARQVAELLLSMGDPIEKIAKVTGLAVDEIRNLNKRHRKSVESPS